MEKNEKLIILGQSGSGKDFLSRKLIKLGLRYSPKFTTRPKRLFETDGVDYNFITNDDFLKLKTDGEIKVSQNFIIAGDVWYYGITQKNFTENQIFIMTPAELSQLCDDDQKKCFKVYLDIDLVIRRQRLTRRNDNNDSIDRRLLADQKDFADFKNYDLKITDPEFDAQMIFDLMN